MVKYYGVQTGCNHASAADPSSLPYLKVPAGWYAYYPEDFLSLFSSAIMDLHRIQLQGTTESDLSWRRAFVAFLVLRPSDFQCPHEPATPGLGFDTASKIVEGFATARNPIDETETSGTLLFTPGKIGTHFICSYGNFPLDASNATDDSSFSPQGQQGGLFGGLGSKMGTFFGSLSFLDQSKTFEVLPGTTTNSTSSSPSNTASPPPNTMNDRDQSRRRGHNSPGIAPIVGGVIGGVALILLLLSIFFYRRLRYQRKLNQFHKEHMLLLQQPPPSLHSSTGANTLVPRFTSPPMATSSLPLAPNRRSDVPPGFEETFQRSYGPLSEGHHSTSSSYTIPLPNEHVPVFQAQHGPGLEMHHSSSV
ncbi:hypothetical protein E1B28_006877 [Marasmius oreades]|uniref:Uncharacterized protein n=1 Tax=Marasmius oreades TaxID=181124 RepID=A0A9P7S125_9AGAR|nr:uncharacterized protein E1B28_006877 [Marasmius oreades]KAG7093188.1 hypothetical protein E1B28_006877 [Marasmius oreades]